MNLILRHAFILSFFVFTACSGGFEKFAPPSNSITGRGAKIHPKILTSTPAKDATITPVTDANGTRIVVVFDMTMDITPTPVINTYFRDIGSGSTIAWFPIKNSGATFTWSSTHYLNDTLTIQLGWVRWPENNILAFDFDNNTLINLDAMTLDNSEKITFTVGWNPGRYKVVQTGQYYCFRYDLISGKWIEETACRDQTNSGGGLIGTYNYPAGQNGFLEPRNEEYGPTIYGAASSIINGRRFRKDQNPLNLPPTGCTGGGNDACYPYTLDSKTNLMWRTCSQGQYYNSVSGGGTLCGPVAGADYTWGDAVNACAVLNNAANGTGYAGRRDWRLPTIEELESLVDFGARITKSTTMPEPNPGYPEVPALDTYQETVWPLNSEGAFPNTPINKGYWTATGVTMLFSGQVLYNQAYTVEFKKGSTGPGPGSNPLLNNKRDPSDFANRNKVRCVAGPLVAPTPPTLTPSTVAASAVLVGNAATFTAPDGGASFNVKSVKPVYNIENNKSTVIVEYDKVPDSTQASTAANYCIAPANAVACGPSSPLVTTIAQVTGNTSAFELTLQTYMGSNTAYKIFVSNVQTKSNQWQTGVNYGVNQFVTDSGNVYRAANAHLSTTIAADVGAGDLVLLNNLVTGTTYSTVGEWLYIPSRSSVVQVQFAFTASALIANDIASGYITAEQNIVTQPPQALTLARALFNGPPRRDAPSATPVFNVVSSSASDLSTITVSFDRLPNSTEAINTGNYCIISASANPFDCTSPHLVGVSSATLTAKTVTLTTASPLTAGTAYAVIASGIHYAGSQVVDDPVNKLRWQRCRPGLLDNTTCDDDGISTNDTMQWNEALNYCDYLNAIRYDDDPETARLLTDKMRPRYAWRAPTLNELKSIAKRSNSSTIGYNIDTTLFPAPTPILEEYFSSTAYARSGPNTGTNTPMYNQIWTFNYNFGAASIAQKDNTTLTGINKPPKRNIRCVRGLP